MQIIRSSFLLMLVVGGCANGHYILLMTQPQYCPCYIYILYYVCLVRSGIYREIDCIIY